MESSLPSPNQPKADDAVLGSQTPPPVNASVLGGLLGVKHRLANPAIEQKITALAEALNYGEEGLELVIQALRSKSSKVRYATLTLLLEQTEPRIKKFLQEYTASSNRFNILVTRVDRGRKSDVDQLLKALEDEQDTATYKLIDYALSLVNTDQGKERIRHYLFNGTQIQRNYAALYFKRQHDKDILAEAFKRGCIDRLQAFPK